MKDQLQREFHLKNTPKRIVSLVPSQTELLVDLGLEHSIVGVTKFCVHPKHLRLSKKVVGGTKQINLQKIKDLKPDIILCNKEENTKEMIEELEAMAPIHVSDIYNLGDCYELIEMYGEIFQVEREASELISNIQKERETFQLQIKATEKQRVAYFIWKNPWMVAASDNFIDAMITEAGFLNAFKDKKRYPEIELEDVNLKEADYIFLSSEPFPFRQEHVLEFQLKFPEKVIKIVDGELFSWYGSRLLKSFNYFKNLQK
ncbi:ABC transporter substrate-binding protein [Winogradskyella bathintestinalis]|uniref:Helical backbone metal receptor n=1 Tax=Winogradskyella bathintestinalis TaxID=3035208 RepID=A0ABT7ZUL3_9FLAO|nr:helical backbone metal receptor [Winogradskyella bathintestinalis]MDN3492706.1 helical backbone metal receptor [Winogradskyella bathintestinalis]